MPDISGFTQFVNENEILHGQHIVQELLEILVDSNQINMQVGEIEGDAIFFYRLGERPSVNELLKQVETMYLKFHQHLQLYDHQRICNCGACRSAVNLTLKVVAHYGEVAQYAVKEHKKLFGKDVIVVHRLLKNNLYHNEYVLMTGSLVKEQHRINGPSWFTMQQGSETYDAGEVQFCFSVLSELRNQVPPPELPHYQLSSGASVAFAEEGTVTADMGKVFNAIFDLEERPKWMDGVKAVEVLNHDKVNRIGAQHRCIVDPKNNPIVVTESATIGKDKIELIEMDTKGMGGCRYQLQQISPDKTKLRMEILLNKSPFVRLMFNLMMKNKMQKRIKQSLVNLHTYCNPAVEKNAPVMA